MVVVYHKINLCGKQRRLWELWAEASNVFPRAPSVLFALCRMLVLLPSISTAFLVLFTNINHGVFCPQSVEAAWTLGADASVPTTQLLFLLSRINTTSSLSIISVPRHPWPHHRLPELYFRLLTIPWLWLQLQFHGVISWSLINLSRLR